MFVINKADRPGADETRRDLESMLDLTEHRDWRPPIVATVATEGTGREELWRAIADHRRHITGTGELERRRADRARDELGRVIAPSGSASVPTRCATAPTSTRSSGRSSTAGSTRGRPPTGCSASTTTTP
ncbi:P-loop NTPase family protein [Actinomarinicola tropica]|uniref:hypothetical protein n=1 Tax=Actinomarinicola tropica TaxID=2789776 RepID=UPI00226C29F9|nr:hypothetical protein [Actinomarinicola tropica]